MLPENAIKNPKNAIKVGIFRNLLALKPMLGPRSSVNFLFLSNVQELKHGTREIHF